MANIERLTELRRVLVAAPEDRFHMRAFSETAPCGTAYCLAGWAAVDPWFQKNTAILEIFHVNFQGMVTSRGPYVFTKLAKMFGIQYAEANDLFGGGLDPFLEPHAVTKPDVYNNIDALLQGNTTEPYAVDDDDDDFDELDDEDDDDDDDEDWDEDDDDDPDDEEMDEDE